MRHFRVQKRNHFPHFYAKERKRKKERERERKREKERESEEREWRERERGVMRPYVTLATLHLKNVVKS